MKYTTSLFSQILQVIPRISFMQMVRKCGAEFRAKGFSSWEIKLIFELHNLAKKSVSGLIGTFISWTIE